MKILIVGGGGREHALVWKLGGDSVRPTLFCAPGNAGTATLATNLPISAEDVPTLLAWAVANRPDLTVVGPEVALCNGIVDAFEAQGLRIFGPNKAAAQLEGSKVFSKEVMVAAGVPTAAARWFTDAEQAIAYAKELGAPVVIKAEGLAAGKGVTVCIDIAAAETAIREALVSGVFGDAGKRVLVEEFLVGEEASVLALVDGERAVLLVSAQDHKRAFDNDQGPNTGGMGAYSPAPVTNRWMATIEREVFGRTLAELKRRGIVYKGILYAGIMVTSGGPKVLEFNCRFGDPETQAILPRIRGDLLPALQACIDGTLTDTIVRWNPQSCACVVMASGGYPGHYEKGKPIVGLDAAAKLPGVVVFHAGTKVDATGAVLTAGGRVLGVTALAANLREAVDAAYRGVDQILFAGAHYRTDIAARALKVA